MKGVVFGAGNIGRGFLGWLLWRAGFSVTFIDIDTDRVDLINERGEYPVFIVSESGTTVQTVKNVSAATIADRDAITSAIVNADIILTAVGKNALGAIAPILARSLIERIQIRPRASVHVSVVACENVQDNTSYLRDLVLQGVPSEYRLLLENMISFPDCVVDRIVPNTLPDDAREAGPLAVAVEDYFQLAIDDRALKVELPTIPGVEISHDLNATLEQKLCTLNMAHAIVGYYGHIRGHEYIHEAVVDHTIGQLLHGALCEVSTTLTIRHPSISDASQEAYARKVVGRFKNPYLRDQVIRVSRDPLRKLGRDDRLVKPAMLAWEQGMVPAFLASGITAALHYDHGSDPQAQTLMNDIRARGIEHVLRQVSGLDPYSPVGQMVTADYHLRAL